MKLDVADQEMRERLGPTLIKQDLSARGWTKKQIKLLGAPDYVTEYTSGHHRVVKHHYALARIEQLEQSRPNATMDAPRAKPTKQTTKRRITCKQLLAHARKEFGDDFAYLLVQCEQEFDEPEIPRGHRVSVLRELTDFARCVIQTLQERCSGFKPGLGYLGSFSKADFGIHAEDSLLFFVCYDGKWVALFNGKFGRYMIDHQLELIGEHARMLDRIYYGTEIFA